MPPQLQDDLLGVAVLTETPDGVAVWTISHGPDGSGGLREPVFAGAWHRPTPRELDLIVRGRIVLRDSEVDDRLEALARSIQACQEGLDATFERSRGGQKWKRPTWRPIPTLSLRAAIAADTPENMRLALARANWALQLLAVWADTENTRLARPYFRHAGPDQARTYPPSWAAGATSSEGSTR